MAYPIIELEKDVPTQLEPLGTKTKFWFRDENGRHVLFKEGRPGTGENWAEKVCCEICRLLNIPHAEYELAKWKNRSGVITPTFVPENARLVLGNELLGRIIKDYDQNRRYKTRQHRVRTVMAVTSGFAVKMPLGWDSPEAIQNAADVFVGYLLLDTLVSNQDRHHENWGLIVSPKTGVSFAPTFDHASSLGRNETDQGRIERLKTRDKGRSVEAYVARAKSAFFWTAASTNPLTTLEAFREAVKISPEAGRYWVWRLNQVPIEAFQRILEQVPDSEITELARQFALKIIETNANRIIETGC